MLRPPPGAAEDPRPIPTPDRRLHVFIASTVVERAEERLAVRDAVPRLRLIPVMFELGARTHPPPGPRLPTGHRSWRRRHEQAGSAGRR